MIDKCGSKCLAIGECGLDYSRFPEGVNTDSAKQE